MGINLKENPKFSWYPGHMVKAQREVKKATRLVDFVIEVADARAPACTRNTDFNLLTKTKPRILILNKVDLADPAVTRDWITEFTKQDIPCISLDKFSGISLKKILPFLKKTQEKKKTRANQTIGRLHRPQRSMVIGMPNVGKSTLINQITRQRKTVTGPLPGVTRSLQWIKLSDEIELLDTPGIATPRIDSTETGFKLGLLLMIKEKLVDSENLVEYLFGGLEEKTKRTIMHSFGMKSWPSSGFQFLEIIGRSRGLFKTGGLIDDGRAASCFINDFRKGKFGRISLERPRTTTGR